MLMLCRKMAAVVQKRGNVIDSQLEMVMCRHVDNRFFAVAPYLKQALVISGRGEGTFQAQRTCSAADLVIAGIWLAKGDGKGKVLVCRGARRCLHGHDHAIVPIGITTDDIADLTPQEKTGGAERIAIKIVECPAPLLLVQAKAARCR